MKKENKLSERELEDDYPIRFGFLYVADGEVIQWGDDVSTAKAVKERASIKSLTNCDIAGRNLWHRAI